MFMLVSTGLFGERGEGERERERERERGGRERDRSAYWWEEEHITVICILREEEEEREGESSVSHKNVNCNYRGNYNYYSGSWMFVDAQKSAYSPPLFGFTYDANYYPQNVTTNNNYQYLICSATGLGPTPG
jgi:hypothetical protein